MFLVTAALWSCSGGATRGTGEAQPRFAARMIAEDPLGGGDGAISPDGMAIALSSQRGGNLDLWRVDIASGRWHRLTSDPAEDFEPQWSPDGSKLVFTSTRGGSKDIWVIDLVTGEEKQLTSAADDEEYPSWSADGRTIVYTGGPWKQRRYFLIAARGGAPKAVPGVQGHLGACSFAHQDRFLVCHDYRTGTGNIVRLSLGRSAGDQGAGLTRGTTWDYKPTASPGGEWVAFSRSDEGPSGIWLVPWKGGPGRALTPPVYDDRWPSWSRAGQLLFHRVVNRGQSIEMLDRDAGTTTKLVSAAEHPLQASLDVTGKRLVFCARQDERQVLRMVDVAGSEIRTLNTGTADACFPRWSPDGRHIAFLSRASGYWDVHTLDMTGGEIRSWSDKTGAKGMYGPLSWSPDGRYIAFQGRVAAFESDLFAIDTQAGRLVRLTDDAWFDEAPSFSADGEYLLFMSTRGGDWTWGLFAMRMADRYIEEIITPDHTEKNWLQMGPDRALVWSAATEQGESLMMRLPGAEPDRVAVAGSGVRWPTFVQGGRAILYTRVERTVQYWLFDHVFGPGSPLAASPEQAPAALAGAGRENEPVALDTRAPGPFVVRASPHSHFRR